VHFSKPKAVSECFSANFHRKGTLQGHCTAAVGHALNQGWLPGCLSNWDNAHSDSENGAFLAQVTSYYHRHHHSNAHGIGCIRIRKPFSQNLWAGSQGPRICPVVLVWWSSTQFGRGFFVFCLTKNCKQKSRVEQSCSSYEK